MIAENVPPGAGFILLHPEGRLWTNQTAGYACLHPQATGFYAPFISPKRLDAALIAIFIGRFNGWCVPDEFDEAAADAFDAAFDAEHIDVKVNRAQLNTACEAWVPVLIGGAPAIFVDENSD